MQDLCFIMQDISLQHTGSLGVPVGSLVMVCIVSSHGCGLTSCGVWTLVVAVGSLVVVCGLSSCDCGCICWQILYH